MSSAAFFLVRWLVEVPNHIGISTCLPFTFTKISTSSLGTSWYPVGQGPCRYSWWHSILSVKETLSFEDHSIKPGLHPHSPEKEKDFKLPNTFVNITICIFKFSIRWWCYLRRMGWLERPCYLLYILQCCWHLRTCRWTKQFLGLMFYSETELVNIPFLCIQPWEARYL